MKQIFVLGHAKCGGARAYVEGHAASDDAPLATDDDIVDWVRIIPPAAKRLGPPPASFDEIEYQGNRCEETKY